MQKRGKIAITQLKVVEACWIRNIIPSNTTNKSDMDFIPLFLPPFFCSLLSSPGSLQRELLEMVPCCEGHLWWLPLVLPALNWQTGNPSTGIAMVIDSFFSGCCWLSGRPTRDTGVVNNWPGARGNVEVIRGNDDENTPQASLATLLQTARRIRRTVL